MSLGKGASSNASNNAGLPCEVAGSWFERHLILASRAEAYYEVHPHEAYTRRHS